jgi:SPP1 gp7 family putative phage head morphogenesis protein
VNYTDQQIEDLLRAIYDGTITTDQLPEDLYHAIAEHLVEGLYKGFGGTLADFTGPSQELLNELRESVYMFSGAKTYQAINDISLIKDDQTIKGFREFRDEALKVYDQYNVNWLQTEYSTAIGQAQNAVRWDQIEQQKETLPYLRYSDVEDDNECEICSSLRGIELPVDDPFWDEYMPENHFNCRCTVEQIDKYDYKETPASEVEERTAIASENMDDIFKMNPGKDGYIFSPEHPYYDVAPRDREYAANNFDLPIPDKKETLSDDNE